LLDKAAQLRPDVVVTDISMPGLSGLEVLRRLKAGKTGVKVVDLTVHAGAGLAAEVMRAGASGFVLKRCASEELVTAINRALQGQVYLTPAVTADVLALMSSAPAATEAHLTPRQREVLRLIMEGYGTKDIAAALNLSTRTVESHKYEMMQALGVQTTVDLVRYAIEHQLVSD
jgi:DNA-binding NarL/FixJ family response regulator